METSIESVNQSEPDFVGDFTRSSEVAWNIKPPSNSDRLGAVIFLCMAFTSVITNLRVLCITIESPRRNLSRQLNILFIQLCIIGIAVSFFVTLVVIEYLNLFPVTGPFTCYLFTFSRSALITAYTLTITGIIYVIVSAFNNSATTLLIWRAVTLIWTVAALAGFPTLFTVEYVSNPSTGLGKCNMKHLMGSIAGTVTLEIVRFILLHFMVSAYICFELYKIRSKVKFLYILERIPRKGVRGAVRRLRFVYLYSTLFVLTWIPSGVIFSLQRVLLRLGVDVSRLPGLITVLTVTHMNQILIPILFLYLNENLRKVYSFVFVFFCKTGSENGSDDHVEKESDINLNENVQGKAENANDKVDEVEV